MILLKDLSGDGIERSLSSCQKWAEYWFDTIDSWNPDLVNKRRVIWTVWEEVPPHAWSPRFFNLVAARIGKIISIHESTIQKSNMEQAYILLRTAYPELPKSEWEVKVGDRIVKVRIKEAPLGYHRCSCLPEMAEGGGDVSLPGGTSGERNSGREESEKSARMNSNFFKHGEKVANPRDGEVEEIGSVRNVSIPGELAALNKVGSTHQKEVKLNQSKLIEPRIAGSGFVDRIDPGGRLLGPNQNWDLNLPNLTLQNGPVSQAHSLQVILSEPIPMSSNDCESRIDSQSSGESSSYDQHLGLNDLAEDNPSPKLRDGGKSKKKKKHKHKKVVSAEELRWEFYKNRATVEAEAKETWNLGVKLGLMSREEEGCTQQRLETMIRNESRGKKKSNKKAKESPRGKY